MNDKFRRKLEMLTRVRDFGVINSALFPDGSRASDLFAQLGAGITQLQALAGAQASRTATSREITTSKSAARAAVIEDLDAIILTARSLAVSKPGLADKFRLPQKTGDQALLASARGFATNADLLKSEFIALEMPADFLDDLNADIAELETALADRHATKDSKLATTSSMESALEKGIAIVQQLQAPVQNKLRNDDGLSTAWRRASRTERSRKSVPAPAPPPKSSGGRGGTPNPAGSGYQSGGGAGGA